MFDGNFRSRPEVNHSSSGNRRRQQQQRQRHSSKSKADLLKNAETQRKQRQEQQKQQRSAKIIQKTTRGFLTRLHLLAEFLPSRQLATVSLCLSLQPWLYKLDKTTKQVLLDYAEYHQRQQQHKPQKFDEAMDDTTTLWVSQQRLVQVTLQELTPNVMNHGERQALFSLLQSYWPLAKQNFLNDRLFLVLCNCFQQWWNEGEDKEEDGNNNTITNSNNNNSEIAQSLCSWSMDATEVLASTNPYTRALLASILLSSSDHPNMSNLYATWVLPLASVLESSMEIEDPLLQATLQNLQGGKERCILSNILKVANPQQQKQDPRPLLQLIHHVLSAQKDSSFTNDLTLAVSLLVRGDSLDFVASTPSSISGSGTSSNNEWGDSDESDDEDDDDDVKPDLKKPRSFSSSKYTRCELLTLVKLDKLYQDRIQQLKRENINTTTFSPATKDLANQIVKAPWLQWGLLLLKDDDSSASSTNDTAVQVYIESLALLLQSTTSLLPTAKIGILSPLAFHRQFLEKLWKHTAQQQEASSLSNFSDVALSVFCDLFAHYLVALSDVDFMKHHTTQGAQHDYRPSGSSNSNLLAQDIIVQLRNRLHDLYWTKPVLTTEIQLDNARGRLLLAGTKVWNSLYERWNRLVRIPFCDESTWWFPHLSSKEGDGAVIPARERQDNDDDDDDAMDIDDVRPMSTAEIETDALADTFRDPKMARVLTSIPQALPFDRRVKLFHSLLKADKQKTMQAAASRRALMAMRQQMSEDDFFIDGSIRERVRIRRASLYKDSMQLLNELGPKLKHQVQVSFVNQHGAEEAGIDGGGVFKEFLDDLIKDGFAAQREDSDGGAPQLFSVTPLQTLAVNPDMAQDPSMLTHYEFLGRVLGKAVYESILVEPQFCLPFLNQLLAKINSMEDLKNFDEEYYKNLNKLKTMSEAEIDGLGLTFELTFGGGTGSTGGPRTVELFRGGRSVVVTKKNVFQYMLMVSNQLLNVQGARQTRAFLRGFRDLIPASWVRLFSANELQKLISGDDSIRGIDVPSLKQAMHYLGGYHASQPYMLDFWEILENELTSEQQRKFLRFMTSCSRQPLLGFGSLEPMPSIQQIRLPDEELSRSAKLPTSQTCMNLLKLPNYKDRNLLKVKLIAAIESGAGFELT